MALRTVGVALTTAAAIVLMPFGVTHVICAQRLRCSAPTAGANGIVRELTAGDRLLCGRLLADGGASVKSLKRRLVCGKRPVWAIEGTTADASRSVSLIRDAATDEVVAVTVSGAFPRGGASLSIPTASSAVEASEDVLYILGMASPRRRPHQRGVPTRSVSSSEPSWTTRFTLGSARAIVEIDAGTGRLVHASRSNVGHTTGGTLACPAPRAIETVKARTPGASERR